VEELLDEDWLLMLELEDADEIDAEEDDLDELELRELGEETLEPLEPCELGERELDADWVDADDTEVKDDFDERLDGDDTDTLLEELTLKELADDNDCDDNDKELADDNDCDDNDCEDESEDGVFDEREDELLTLSSKSANTVM
jgi:hypothetical protein